MRLMTTMSFMNVSSSPCRVLPKQGFFHRLRMGPVLIMPIHREDLRDAHLIGREIEAESVDDRRLQLRYRRVVLELNRLQGRCLGLLVATAVFAVFAGVSSCLQDHAPHMAIQGAIFGFKRFGPKPLEICLVRIPQPGLTKANEDAPYHIDVVGVNPLRRPG